MAITWEQWKDLPNGTILIDNQGDEWIVYSYEESNDDIIDKFVLYKLIPPGKIEPEEFLIIPADEGVNVQSFEDKRQVTQLMADKAYVKK